MAKITHEQTTQSWENACDVANNIQRASTVQREKQSVESVVREATMQLCVVLYMLVM